MTLDGWNFLFKMLRRKLAEIEAFYGERIKIKAESKVWNFPSYFSLFFSLFLRENEGKTVLLLQPSVNASLTGHFQVP